MRKRILSLLLAFVMLCSMLPVYQVSAAEEEKAVTVWYFNPTSKTMEEATSVELYRSGELYLSAALREGLSGEIRWQIEVQENLWVDIQGNTSEDLRISYSMVHSLLKDDSVRMRCAVSGNGDYYSDPFTVTVTDVEQQLTASVFRAGRTPVAPDPLPAPVGVPNKTMPKTPEDTLPAATEETVAAAIQETNPAVTEESEDEEEAESEAGEETIPTITEEAESEDEEETASETSEENTPIVTEEVESENEEESESENTQKAASYLTEKTVVIEEEAVPLAASFSAQIVLLSSVVPAAQSVEHALPEEDAEIYTVTIEYLYGDNSKFSGQRVALPYIAEVSAGEILDATVSSPNCVGYAPEITSINLADQGQITSNVNLTVKYSPAEVSYTVRHYQQNVDNDEYSWVDTTMATGYTEALTSDAAAKTYTGFTALSHYHEEIAADSSTLIDIYYDRNYYLMSFDLKGGYGVEPIYARYGVALSVGTPNKAGWIFGGWMDTSSNFASIPKTMPNGNRTYTATWNPQNNVGYRVTYWIVNENNSKTLLGSHIEYGASGAKVDGTDNLGTEYGTICGEEWSHVHSSECYRCGITPHSHVNDCFKNVTLTANDPGDNGRAAINALGAESGYIYVIYNRFSQQYWPKLYLNGSYWLVNGIEGGKAESSFSSIISGEALSSKTGTFGDEYLTVTKYQAKTDCGNFQHVHSTTCEQICQEHTHTSQCYQDTRHLEFVDADQDVVINGDGTSTVNVYYRYKEYTLRFYYAASTGTGQDVTYKIVGGCSYFFGEDGPDTSDDEALLENQYWSHPDQWGTVYALPELNDRGNARNYERGSVTYENNGTNVTYYYISFKARFGDDISDRWPCGVFNSATRTDNNGTNGWSGKEAFVSAWNGEDHVKYSQDNENETIKGVYEKLDENLLFSSKFSDEQVVSYLCFWENGANIKWSVPELYRYNIYLSAYSGQVIPEDVPTVQRDGVTYYLADTYDTCDNSTIDEQTQVALKGYSTRTFNTPRDGYLTSNAKHFEYRTLSGTTDEAKLQQDGYFDSSLYKEGYEVNFFYVANTYKLSFWNYDRYLTNGTGSLVSYKEPLKKYFDGIGSSDGANDLVEKPEHYPDALETNAYEFDGWYASAGFEAETKVNPDNMVMPAEALMVYARWVPVTREVKIYLAEGSIGSEENIVSSFTVPNNTLTSADHYPDESKLNHPTDSSATFIGWFYEDETGKEQAFSFANTPITQDMTIYAKWRSNLMKQVEIHYVVEDDNGNQIPIANTETLMLHLGQTRTFEAKTGSTLYTQYRSHCFPVIASHSITITDADIENPDPVSYTFVYKQYYAIPYQIRYFVEKDGNKWPAFRQVTQNGSKAIEFVKAEQWQESDQEYIEMHWDNDKAVVTELYIPDALRETHWTLPNNYLPNALRIKQIIIPSGENPEENIEANTIEFVYTYTEPKEDPDNPDTPVYAARYLVQHYVQSTSGEDAYNLYSYSDESGFSGETATASPISIPGYTFSAEQTNSKKKADTTLNADQTMSGKIVANNSLELNFYYTVNTYPYQVMYLEEGTNRILAAAKTTATDGSQLMGQYGSPVTETAITIEGYDIVGADSKTIEIQMEVGSEASVNTIVFYYKRKSAELILSKSVELDKTQAAQEGIADIPSWVYDQEFEFTVYQPEGYPKSVYHYTFTDANGNSEERTVNAGVQTITVKLKHGEQICFHDFPMGTYTVTETYVPGFRTSVDDFIAQSHTVTLDTDDQTGQLDFVNTFPFYTGDLVLHKRVTKLHDTDPTATKPYTVTVVLKPHDSAREIDRVITWTNAGAEEPSTFTVPALSETNQQKEFTISVLVPVDSEVKLEGVPVGDFSATEETQGTLGYIYDYYTVKYNKAVHQNDEVTGTNHIVRGSIHGGHPTAVTFHNTYKKGTLTIHKTVNQEYENDLWQSDFFTFHITGTTELPDGEYWVEGAKVTVANGTVTVTDASGKDPTISITRTDDSAFWSSSLTFENLPAGYYTVTETAGLGNDQYSSVCPQNNLLVNNVLQETEANFINTYKRHLRDLTITTVCSDKTQSFLFDVSANDTEMGDVHQTVVLVGSDSQTIRDLPVGEYTVTEQTQWSWRETDVASQTVALQEENKTVSFDFGNIDRIYWLNGYSYHRKGGS